MTLPELKQMKQQGRKLSMVTCYDYWSARLLNESPLDMILVGDSAAMVMHGHTDTIPATIQMMCAHIKAVRKGAPKKFLVADLPFLAFRSDLNSNIQSLLRIMQAGAQAVKLEGYDGNGEFIRHMVESGIPVMGHLGLTPQFVHAFGGFRVQGRELEQRKRILDQARRLEEAGCFSLVLECVPRDLAAEVTSTLSIPTIGIGAGPQCDGQVLVLQDLLGMNTGFKPKFLRRYLNGAELIQSALNQYHEDVVAGRFPNAEESYE